MDFHRIKSDVLRFKYINKFIKGNILLDIGSLEGDLHKRIKDSHTNMDIYSLDNSNEADFTVDLDKPLSLHKKFDTIIAGEIIEHLESPILFIRFCKNHLKQGGRLILTTPNAIGLQYIVNPAWCVYYTSYRGHTQAFTIEMLKRIFQDEGFSIIYKDYINAFWIHNPLQFVSKFIKRLRPDLIVVAEKK